MFSEMLKSVRENKKLSQYAFARQMGVSQSTVGMWESGKREPNFETVKKISEFFGIPTDYLLSTGVFENWGQISEHWIVVATYLDETFKRMQISFEGLNFFDLALIERIKIIGALCVKIKFDVVDDTNVNVDFYFKLSNNNNPTNKDDGEDLTLSPPEEGLIKKYRALDLHGKKIVHLIIDAEYERAESLENLTEKQELLKPSKPKSNIIQLSGEDERQECSATVDMKVFNESAAAGFGNYLSSDGYDYEIIAFPAESIPRKADFGIRISGNSMEPEIKNDEIVWVKEQTQVENNELGIFILNGRALCKKLYVDYENKQVSLMSCNEDYDPIIIGEYDELRTVGKVLNRGYTFS